ncbi:MAG: crosslink repair DNA glycosylase YcaQ family protein [Paracoccaceae bacterium]
MTPILPNLAARRLFLHRHGLAETPTGIAHGQALTDLISRIGFVQVDSINTVERAHHMILFARRQSYQPPSLAPLLDTNRQLFEHWTHDASILPLALFPHWHHRFSRDALRLKDNWQSWFRDGYTAKFDTILRQISDHGPVTTSDVGQGEERGKGGWWDWHPSKTALEWLWRTGQLSIARRVGFQKVYDLTERVIPETHRTLQHDTATMVEWACASALHNLGFATSGELAAYWKAASPAEARDWCRTEAARGALIEVDVQAADGALRRSYARPDVVQQAADAPEPPSRIRILSPFDPALRDRNRTERLFGFYYRIEVFVPEPKRQYGYYVFPVLEGASIIGRIDGKAFRDENTMRVKAFWPESGISLGKSRLARLESAVAKLAQFAGCDNVAYDTGWQRDTL